MAHQLPKTRKDLLPMLEAAGLKPHRGWGQSFLLDANMLDAIARDAEIEAGDLVLEIGAGPATLTEFLMERARLVVSVEVDRGMAAFVASTLQGADNFVLVNADILPKKRTLNADVVQIVELLLAGSVNDNDDFKPPVVMAPRYLPRRMTALKVVANLPYSIASPLLVALLESSLPIASLTLLFQREVAERLIAHPGEKDYGLLSVLVAMHGQARILRHVPNTCFWPKPKIESSLVRVTPHSLRMGAEDYARVKLVASAALRYRRKTIVNALHHGLELDRASVLQCLAAAGIELSAQTHRLGIEDYRAIAGALPATTRNNLS